MHTSSRNSKTKDSDRLGSEPSSFASGVKGTKKRTNKFITILLISVFVTLVLLVTLFFVKQKFTKDKSSVINPFTKTSSESKNPFDVKTQNPFTESKDSTNPFAPGKESQEYQNPFEKLR
jgi:hypothetical protein